MTSTSITNFRKNLSEYVEQTVTCGDIVHIATDNGSAVLLSEAEYNGLLETLRLSAIPGMTEELLEAAAEPLADCIPYDPNEAW